MAGSTRNLLKAFGEDDHRETAANILAAIFGDCIWDLSVLGQAPTPAGVLLAAVHFESPAGPPITWVEELSGRMPAVTFELWANPAPDNWKPDCRQIVSGGRLLGDVDPGDPAWIRRNLLLAEPAFAIEGPLDLVAITIAIMDRYYRLLHDDIVAPIHWKDWYDIRAFDDRMKAIEGLLAPADRRAVDLHRKKHAEHLARRTACQRAADGLRTVIDDLSNPCLADRLDEEDRRVIDRLRLLERSLDTRDYVTPSVNLAFDVAAAS